MASKRILIGSLLEPYNGGDMAVTVSMARAMRQLLPDAELTIMVSSSDVARNRYRQLVETDGVEYQNTPWFRSASSKLMTKAYSGLSTLKFMLANRWFFRKHDLFIELGTDTHTDYYGRIPFFFSLYPLLLCWLAGRPFVLCAETVGPFKYKLSRQAARFVLGKAKLITVRDEASQRNLQALGIEGSHLVSDLAFLLDPAPAARLREVMSQEGIVQRGRPLVGLSASQLIPPYAFSHHCRKGNERRSHYVRAMAEAIDHIAEVTNGTVILIPHVDTPRSNDRSMHEEIYCRVRAKDNVMVIKGEYTAGELKGVIGTCHMFLGCRMHATVAAVSTCVPTIAISYSQKFRGVLGSLLDHEGCILDIREFTPQDFSDKLSSKIDYVWANRDRIRHELGGRMAEVRERAIMTPELVCRLLPQ